MAWVKLDDQFFGHPKAIAAGKDAVLLNLASWCWSSQQLTDGFIPAPVVAVLAASVGVKPAVHRRLVDEELWHEQDGGYLIHDYLEYQPCRTEVLEAQRVRHEAKVNAGRSGGIASGVARRKHNGTKHEAGAKQA